MRARTDLAAAALAALVTAGAFTAFDRDAALPDLDPPPSAVTGLGDPVQAGAVAPGQVRVAPNEQVRLLTNTFRRTVGCRPLSASAPLRRAAAGHSRDMVTRQFFAHDAPGGPTWTQRIRAQGVKANPIGENIAFGFTGPTAPVDVVRAWIASPGHRANLANCRFKRIGVANVGGYWTQNFSG